MVFFVAILLIALSRPLGRKILLTLGLVLLGLLIAYLFVGLTADDVHGGPEWVFGFFLLVGATWLLVWWLNRLFGPAPPVACPALSRLKDFLAECLPRVEHDRLAAHLEVCKACQHRLEGLTAGQGLGPDMARKLSDRPPAPEPALQRVMGKLKGEAEQEGTTDEPRFAGDLPLGFLNPPEKPGQLGRLERYEVLEEIGRGGMGVVLKAFDPSLHRVVAIKVLAPQLATSGVARKRFLREAKAAAAVTHDHIVTIHAVDEANGLPYLVMQYVAGGSLQDRIDAEGPLEPAEVLRIGVQTASGLAAAHAHGIVHRDIKPGNILLEEGVPRVKITDFGLARAMDDASLTQSGFVAGSPLYMAPEQARGESLDHRADLFSLGSVLYTLCTGRPPFRAANTLAVLRRVSEDIPRPIRETNPEVPEGLVAVVDKLLAKEPAERYQSASEVVEALGQQLAQLQHAAWVPPPRPAAPPAATAGLPTSVTICPSCGASLQVPERLVGSVVHCAECGKPFQVEDGPSIEVARAVAPPFRPRRRRHVRGWALTIGIVAAVLLLLALVAAFALYRAKAARREAAAALIASQTARDTMMQGPRLDHLLNAIPTGATMFGAIDLRPFGSFTPDEPRTQTVLRLLLPAETADRLTPENLGRIQVDGMGMAYYTEGRIAGPWWMAHLQGVALDGRQRAIDLLRNGPKKDLRIEAGPNKGSKTSLARVSGPKLLVALGLIDDNHAYLAGSLAQGATGAEHLQALEQGGVFDFSNVWAPVGPVLTGYNPPWVKEALAKLQPDACGFCLGELPAEWRQLLRDSLKLRVSPRTFVAHLRRHSSAVTLSLTLSVDRPSEALLLRDDLEKWRTQALDEWRERYPAIKGEPGALALVGQALKSMHWGASGGSVSTNVQMSYQTLQALADLLRRTVGKKAGNE
jgi:hypothetical protein